MGSVVDETEKRNAAESRARQWITRGGLIREDSDDELGVEDHPWEWILEAQEEDGSEVYAAAKTDSTAKIVGARTKTTSGYFECRLGDTVLLKSPEAGKDWVGIVSEFIEEEDEDGDIDMNVEIMWMASTEEFATGRNKHKKRPDCMPNEQYLTMNFDSNPLNSINGKATVMSREEFMSRYPDGVAPKGKAKAAFDKCIICRRAVDQRRGVYTDEFKWGELHQELKEDLVEVVSRLRNQLKASKKRKADDTEVSLSLCSNQPGLS